MKRILFISPLDRRTVANTREQNIAAACHEQGHRTLSLTLAQNTSRQPWAILRDALSWRAIPSADGLVICIDPPLNPCTGLHTNLLTAEKAGPARRTSMRRRLVGMLSPLGVLRDVAIIPAFLLHALRHGHFELCIAYGPWAACVGWLLRQLGRVDILIYDDQDYEPAIMGNRTRQRWAIYLERAMMRRADLVVSVGERLAALRREQTGCQVTVIPNGVREPRSSNSRAPATNPENHVFTLVYVGNVVAWSGLDEMLAALPEVLASGLTLRVLIIGDGLPAYVQGLHEQVRSLGLQTVVHFAGRIANEHIGERLSQADVGLAHFRPEPYRRYAFPLKVVEYMAAGLAVIGTRDTETEDILHRHAIGIAVNFERHEIAAAILRLATDRDLLAHYRANARCAVNDYQWSALAAHELQLAEAVRQQRTKPQVS